MKLTANQIEDHREEWTAPVLEDLGDTLGVAAVVVGSNTDGVFYSTTS